MGVAAEAFLFQIKVSDLFEIKVSDVKRVTKRRRWLRRSSVTEHSLVPSDTCQTVGSLVAKKKPPGGG